MSVFEEDPRLAMNDACVVSTVRTGDGYDVHD